MTTRLISAVNFGILFLLEEKPLVSNPASWPLRGVRSFYWLARFSVSGSIVVHSGDGCETTSTDAAFLRLPV